MVSDRYNDHMTRKVTATQAKAKLLALLDEVSEGEEVEITKHGRTVARLVPAPGGRSLLGMLKGVAWSADPNDELLSTDEVWSVTLE